MCGRFALYAEPAKVARFLQGRTPRGRQVAQLGLENLDELQGQLKPAEGTFDPVSKDVQGSPNDGAYLPELNCE